MFTAHYHTIRKDLKRGDIVLYHNGGGIMGNLIQLFDNSHFTHAGIIDKISGRIISIDMWKEGMEIVPLSRRMRSWKEFIVLRPVTDDMDVEKAIDDVYNKIWEREVKRDRSSLLRMAIKRRFKINLGRVDRYVCSELIQHFTGNLGIKCYENLGIITPQDFIRHIDLNEMEFIVH